MPGPPFKQYELTLQNAQRVLMSLLEQPAKPWVPFDALLLDLSHCLTQLHRRSAAVRLQRGLRKWGGNQRRGCGKGNVTQSTPPSMSMEGGYVADAPKKMVPVPPRIQAPGGPMNPLEKRRHRVAAQLAISNPARLPRSRRWRGETPAAALPREGPPPTAIQEESPVALPKLQPLVATVTRKTRLGDVTEGLAGTAPAELLLKENGTTEPMDQIALMGQCDSAGISMAPPPSFGTWPRPNSAPRRYSKGEKELRGTPPSTAQTTAGFYSTASTLTMEAFEESATRSDGFHVDRVTETPAGPVSP